MPKFAALLQFLLALGGCAMGGTTYTHRISQDGHDVLASEARLQDGVARFDCEASDSGWCHYTLYADACDAGSGRGCSAASLPTFTPCSIWLEPTRIAAGESSARPAASSSRT